MTRQASRQESRQEHEAGGNNDNTSKESVGEPRFESPSVPNAPVDTTNPSTQAIQSDQVVDDKRPSEEHNGEVVVEAEEDTVIY